MKSGKLIVCEPEITSYYEPSQVSLDNAQQLFTISESHCISHPVISYEHPHPPTQ